MKGQVRFTPPAFLDGELTIASLDGYGRVRTVVESGGGGGGDASAANQTTQIGLETDIKTAVESIDTKTVGDNPDSPLQTAQLRQAVDFASIPVGGIDTTAILAGYPYPACGYWAYDGTHLDIRGVLDATTVIQVPGSGYWDNLMIARVEDSSDVTSFTLYWR